MVVEGVRIKLFLFAAIAVLAALPWIHPFGPVRKQQSTALPIDDPGVLAAIQKACQDCHSQRTQWPLYSHLPVVSWALERDVAEARRQMDLSRWDRYSTEEKRDLLARIASEVRNGRMPLPRYLLLHPEARLSSAETRRIYEWTQVQRHALRSRRE
jgi:hypothetical protein